MFLLQETFRVLNDQQSTRLFNMIFAASQLFGAFAVLLVIIWISGFEDGFAWGSNPELQFHYHPTFMVMGIIFLASEAILVYRVFRHEPKRFCKLLHLTLHTMVLIFIVVSLKAVFDSHNNHKNEEGESDPLPNLYSLHSWVGMTAALAFFLQYVLGFTTFFFPGWSASMRQLALPFHQAFGVIIICFVAITAVMGISEHAAWRHKCWTIEHKLCGEQFISTLLGISILLFIMCVVIIILNPRWRRHPLPEEESLHRLTSTE
ncbi:unnamed protein product [Thelazia callipaeda]|uniref:Cytochrome b561 domain-containing protein n=1 Tax=Thelazia callipaeda TaxID=103827 RepID=A0A0N5CSR9_THECL|nr:unnamed protein product [Thelazia callipaeda]